MSVMAKILSLLVALAIPVLLANCSTNSAQTPGIAGAAQADSTETASSVTAEPAGVNETASSLANAGPREYTISPYDSLQISVFQVQDLNRTVNVNADGSVTLPLVGKLMMAGKTTQQAEELLAERLRKSYLQSPQVSVAVAKFGQRVTVNGSVKTPKVITVDGQLTLTEAIANAGGLSDLANGSRVHIVRKKGQGLTDEVHDLGAIQAGRIVDPRLQGSDLVVVEESGVKVAFKNVKDVLPFAVLATVF